MMTFKHYKYLADIEQSILHIESFWESVSNETDYANNLMLRRAVERELEIIGEAMTQLQQLMPKVEIPNSRQIIDTRNFVLHIKE